MRRFIRSAELPGAGVVSARIRSLDGCVYVVELACAGGGATLSGDGRSSAIFRSLAAARAALSGAGRVPLSLVHDSAYDEMIGLGAGGGNRLELALGASDD